MLLQHQTISRKTPADGRIEISYESVRRITAHGRDLAA